ncbi:Intraflagellar transport protein 172 homolog, partial [Aduncisulcus paluster]
MKLKHDKTIYSGGKSWKIISKLEFSGNSKKLAAVCDKFINIFDEKGERKDKFFTKPANKGPKNFFITDCAFYHDGSRLATCQTDGAVFVFKFGKEKKSIGNRFLLEVPATCMCWPKALDKNLLVGTATGEIKLCVSKGNTIETIYSPCPEPVTCMSYIPDSSTVFAGFANGDLHILSPDSKDKKATKLYSFPCPITHLKCTKHSVLIGLANGSLLAMTPKNSLSYHSIMHCEPWEIEMPRSQKPIQAICCDPSAMSCLVLRSHTCLMLRFGSSRQWECARDVTVRDGFFSAAAWRNDGAVCVIGTVYGDIDMFSARMRTVRLGDYEATFSTPSSFILSKEAEDIEGEDGEGLGRWVITSSASEISSVKVVRDRFLVARTPTSLLVGDLLGGEEGRGVWGEVPWRGGGKEKFLFDTPGVVLIHNAGEIVVIPYGSENVLCTVRTEHASPALLSVRLGVDDEVMVEKGVACLQPSSTPDDDEDQYRFKRFACLADRCTISVTSLEGSSFMPIFTVQHDTPIDWVELNDLANLMLFRDRKRRLFMVAIPPSMEEQEAMRKFYLVHPQARQFSSGSGMAFEAHNATRLLLDSVGYVQWVPGSDVCVAQSGDQLFVFYSSSASAHSRPTQIMVKGEAVAIERESGMTVVLVEEEGEVAEYQLSEPLILFGTALDRGNMHGAIAALEDLPIADAVPLWKRLASVAIACRDLAAAQEAFSALGFTTKARMLRQLMWKVEKMRVKDQKSDGEIDAVIQSTLVLLEDSDVGRTLSGTVSGSMGTSGDSSSSSPSSSTSISASVSLLLSFGRVDDAIALKKTVLDYKGALEIAEQHLAPSEVSTMRVEFEEWLKRTGQQAELGRLSEKSGDFEGAASLYLKGGAIPQACELVKKHGVSMFSSGIIENIIQRLKQGRMYGTCGEFLTFLGRFNEALEEYKRGKEYRNALTLARQRFPDRVRFLESEWGDYLVAQQSPDIAVGHYIEAGEGMKALEAALAARQWKSIVRILPSQDVDSIQVKEFTGRLAEAMVSVGRVKEGISFFLKAGLLKRAVDVCVREGEFAEAKKIASSMSPSEASALLSEHAHVFVKKGKIHEGCDMLVTIGHIDDALSLCLKNGAYDHAVTVAKRYKPDALEDVSISVSNSLAKEGKYDHAEQILLSGGYSKAAVDMYVKFRMFREALRIGRGMCNDTVPSTAYIWYKTLGESLDSMEIVAKEGCANELMNYAINMEDFDTAALAAQHTDNPVISAEKVEVGKAVWLEEQGRHTEAEASFIEAKKPREAVLMWIHVGDFESAMRVASDHCPSSVQEVKVAEAEELIRSGDVGGGARLLVQANKAHEAVIVLKESHMWSAALAVAKAHVPHMVSELAAAYAHSEGSVQRASSPTRVDSQPVRSQMTMNVDEDEDDMLASRTTSKAAESKRGEAARQHETHDSLISQRKWVEAFEVAASESPQAIAHVGGALCTELIHAKQYIAALCVMLDSSFKPHSNKEFVMMSDALKNVAGQCISSAQTYPKPFLESVSALPDEAFPKQLYSIFGAENTLL